MLPGQTLFRYNGFSGTALYLEPTTSWLTCRPERAALNSRYESRSGGCGGQGSRRLLTCHIHVDGGLAVGLLAVAAAEGAGVLGAGAAHPQEAAVLLSGPPASPLLHLHLMLSQRRREGPGQLPATPGPTESGTRSLTRK